MKNLQNAALSSSLIFSVNNHFYVAHSTSKKNQFLWLAVTFMSFIFLRFSISFFGVKETTYRKYRVFFLSLPIIAKITTARNPINSGCVIYGLIHPLSPFVSISSFPLFNVFHSLFSLSLSSTNWHLPHKFCGLLSLVSLFYDKRGQREKNTHNCINWSIIWFLAHLTWAAPIFARYFVVIYFWLCHSKNHIYWPTVVDFTSHRAF